MSRTYVVVATAVAIALTTCGSPAEGPGGVGPETIPTETSEAPPDGDSTCGNEIPFDVTYLPKDFSREQRRGKSPPAPAAQKGQAVVHYAGSRGRFLEIRRPATLFTELALPDDAPTIRVLGDDTPNFGPQEPGGDQFIVQFRYKNEAAEERCTEYSLDGYGVSLDELKKVAEGLQPD